MKGRWLQYGAALALVQLMAACGQEPQGENASPGIAADNRTVPGAPAAATADQRLVVALGDSLFAGYGLAQEEGFAPALERALSARGVSARVVNAGVSGDTSAAGRARMAFVLDGLNRKPDLVIVGLGANDMLRGLDPAATRENLDAMLAELQRRGIPAMLTGMVAAPNMGADYATAFNRSYPELAARYDVPLYPFFLDRVIGNRALLLPDGIHPNAAGVNAVAGRVAPLVEAELRTPAG